MKILLIVPPFNVLKDGYGSKIKINKGNLPSLGICYIAASLEKNNHQVKILDALAEGLSIEETISKSMEFNPDLIGLSLSNSNYIITKDLIRLLKEKIGKPIVCGGTHISCFPKKILKELKEIDFAVIGEGESTIIDIVDALENGDPFENIKGIAYRFGNEIKINKKRELLIRLDELPLIPWNLLNIKLYCPLPDQYRRLPAISMVTSRGCTWGKCTFCFESGINRKLYRRHSPERVIQEIKILQKEYGIREIDFLDDEFFLNEKWIRRFCQLIHDKKIDLSWSALGRVDNVTPDMFKLARSAGCWGVLFGIESGNQDILDKIKKGITLEQVRKACKWANDAKMSIRASFMLGLPNETPEKAQNTINFAKELGLTTVVFNITFPEFGTELYDIAINEGRFIDKWVSRNKCTYIPNGYKSAEQIEKIQRSAVRQFYLRPRYVYERLKEIKSIDDIKRNIEGFKLLLGIIKK